MRPWCRSCGRTEYANQGCGRLVVDPAEFWNAGQQGERRFGSDPLDGCEQFLIALEVEALANQFQHPFVDRLVFGLECPEMGRDRLPKLGQARRASLQVSASIIC